MSPPSTPAAHRNAPVLLLALLGTLWLALWFDTRASGVMPLFWSAALLLVCASVWLPARLPGWAREHPAQAAWLLGLLLWLVVLHRLSLSPDAGFKLSILFALLLLCFALLVTAPPVVRRWLWWGSLATGALLLAVACWDYFSRGVRASWPLDDPNNFAALIYLLYLPWLHTVLCRAWRGDGLHPAAFPATVLVVVAVFASESRAGLGVLAVAFAVWLALAALRGLSLRPVLLHGALAAAAFSLCLLSLGAAGIAPGGENTLSGGLAVRALLIQVAFDAWLERPWVGMGLNMFPALYAARRPLIDQETAGRFVHNDYVQLLLEGGPLLLLALLVLGLWCLRGFWRCARAAPESPAFAAFGFALAACALLGHALVNFTFYRFSLPLVLVFHLATLSAVLSAAQPAQPTQPAPGRGLVLAALLGGWMSFAYLTLDVAVAGVIEGQDEVPLVAPLRSDAASVHRFARRAAALNSRRGLPQLADAALSGQQAVVSGEVELAADALVRFRKAQLADPWNPRVNQEFARFVAAAAPLGLPVADHEQPRSLLLQALALDRANVSTLDGLLAQAANPPEREQMLRRLVLPWFEIIARNDIAAAQRFAAALAPLVTADERLTQQRLLARLARENALRERLQH